MTPETPKGAERLTTERVKWIASFPPLPLDGSPSEHALPLQEVRALAREVLELREMLRPKGDPNCASCGGAGWYQWTAGDKTVSEDCHCRPSPVPPKEERDGE